MASTEIDEWVKTGGIPNNIAAFARAVELESTMDNGAAVRDIMAQILAADDMEAVFAAAMAGTVSGKDFADTPFFLRKDDIEWKMSASAYRENGQFPFYTLLRVGDLETGEKTVVSCGGTTFVTTIWRLIQIGAFDKFDDRGMPLIIKAKPAGLGHVLIPQLYKLPKTVHASGSSK